MTKPRRIEHVGSFELAAVDLKSICRPGPARRVTEAWLSGRCDALASRYFGRHRAPRVLLAPADAPFKVEQAADQLVVNPRAFAHQRGAALAATVDGLLLHGLLHVAVGGDGDPRHGFRFASAAAGLAAQGGLRYPSHGAAGSWPHDLPAGRIARAFGSVGPTRVRGQLAAGLVQQCAPANLQPARGAVRTTRPQRSRTGAAPRQ